MTSAPTRRGDAGHTEGRLNVGRLIAVASAVLMLAAIAVYMAVGTSSPEARPAGIVIVPGASVPSAAPSPAVRSEPAAPLTGGETSVDRLRSSIAQAFPTLEDAKIICQQKCELQAHVSPSEDARFAEGQLPYLGRLEQFLTDKGFHPIDSLMIEEVGEDDNVVRISFGL